MILKLEINGKTKEVVLGQDEVNEFRMKNHSVGFENSLEEFILNDVAIVLSEELYETNNNQFFNY